MTSKSSFLANLRENNKRRLWVWVISALVFVLAFPILISIMISQIKTGSAYLKESFSAEVAEEILHERLLDAMRGQLGFSVKMVGAGILAVISAIQGFSYLYSRKKMDFYMGMPVKRSKRFLIIWLNGILLYVVPALLGLVIEILIAAGNGAMDVTVAYSAFCGSLVHLVFYLSIYHLSLLAVMLTGNVIITCCGILVLFLYEYAVRWMVGSYQSFFFRYFDYYNTRTEPVFSPFAIYSSLADTFAYENRLDPKAFAGLLLFGLLTGAAAYFCYRKRPAEAAGKAMTFEVTKPVIKILLTIPASLLAGMVIGETVGYEPEVSSDGMGYMVLAILLVVVIGSGVIQVIYEFDLKGALHKKLHILISGAAVALIFLIFHNDLFGYDRYVPRPEQVESIAFVPELYEQSMSNTYFDKQGHYLSDTEYADQNMYLHDVEAVCTLARHSIDEYDKVAADLQKNYDEEKAGRWSRSTLIYRLKSGKTVCRRLMVNVDDEAAIGLLDQIMGSDEFKKGYMIGASEQVKNMLREEGRHKVKADYGNMVYWKDMSRQEAIELLELYQRDLSRANFTNIRENVPDGMIRLQITEDLSGGRRKYGTSYDGVTRTTYLNINVYPFYEECMGYLKEHGYYMENQLDPEDVAYIQIMNRNMESYRELEKQMGITEDALAVKEGVFTSEYEDADRIDTRVYKEYRGEEEIRQIASCCYPVDFIDSYDWDRGIETDNDYVVYVYFNTDSPMTKSYGTSAQYSFLKGNIPEFVAGDTAYRE